MTAAKRQLTRRLKHLHLKGIQLDFCSSAPRASATSSSRPAAVSRSVRLHMVWVWLIPLRCVPAI